MARKSKKKKSVLSGLIIVLCILLILPAASFIANLNKRDIVLSSQDLSYNGDVSQILPDKVSFDYLGKDYKYAVDWDIEDFDNQKVGKQRVYATFADDSVYFRSGIKDIYIDVNVLSHGVNSTVTSGLEYSINNDKSEYVVAGCTDSETDVVIPAVYKGKPVTKIGSGAFAGFSLTSLEFPASIKAIGPGAFDDDVSSLAKINFLGSIDQWCEIEFANAYSTPVRLSNDLYLNDELVTDVKLTNATKISAYAFYSCRTLKSIEISNTVESIGSFAFRYCTSLESVIIPYGVASIGQYAFDGCKSLEIVELPNSITSLESYLFHGCTALKSIEIPRTVESIGEQVFKNCVALTNIVIPDTVRTIGQYSFVGCTSLESVKLSNNLTSLESHLFQDCTSLKSIEIPRSVINIADLVFYNTTSLTSIYIPNTVETMGAGKTNGVIRGCSADLLIYCEAESIPSGWTSNWNYNNRTVEWGYQTTVE